MDSLPPHKMNGHADIDQGPLADLFEEPERTRKDRFTDMAVNALALLATALLLAVPLLAIARTFGLL
jgi:hypothetical protein